MWEYKHDYLTQDPSSHVMLDTDMVFCDDIGSLPTQEQGSMFASSLNIYEQTGLTPVQLQARVAELEEYITKLQSELSDELQANWELRNAL